MANKGRSNRGPGRNTSFGKRQSADDDFRKKKKEGGRSEGRSSSRPAGRSSGSSYGRPTGKPYGRPTGGSSFGRKRSDGDERPKRDDSRGDDRPKRDFRGTGGSSYAGGKRSFSTGPRDEKRPFRKEGEGDDKKPFRKRSFGDGERKPFGEKKPFGERRSYGEKKSFDGGEKKPFRKRTSGEDKPYEKRSSSSSSSSPRKKPYEKKSFVESKVASHRERVEKPSTEREPASDGLIRLNKFISNSGVCSRREADELIKLGVITVNGTTITEMGYKVKPEDDVRHEGKRLTAEKPVYILLNKPKGFITTTDDPQERNTVMQLVSGACKERVYPVGRLDRNTTGLLLLTNDGDLTDKLTHPSFNAKKIYKVELDRPLTKEDFQRIIDGVSLDEGKALVDDLAIVSDDSRTVGIELHIGWNHVVRRIFDALQYQVIKLDRVVYAGLDKKDLKRGDWRFLKQEEIVRLKHFK